jgi:hypothetical protein
VIINQMILRQRNNRPAENFMEIQHDLQNFIQQLGLPKREVTMDRF